MSRTSKSPSREAKVAAQRRAVQVRAQRARALKLGLIGGLVVAVIGIGIAIQANRGNNASSGTASPANTTGAQNSIFTVVAPEATPTSGAASPTSGATKAATGVMVDIYEDFQCPACQDFESKVGSTLKSLVAQQKITLRYHPIAFLDRGSSTKYSTRSLNAAACVIDSKPSAYPAFHDLLFAQQPPEGSAGLNDATLISLTDKAGAPGLNDCVRKGTFKGWAARVTDQASKENVNSTPTVLVAGQPLTDRTPAALQAAVQAATKS